VIARKDDLGKSMTGRQLLQLFARVELATYRHVSIAGNNELPFDRWKDLTYCPQISMVTDIENGDDEFERAWISLMKILGKLMEVRTDLDFERADATRGTSDVVTKGNMLRGMLQLWEMNLPASFHPIECPGGVQEAEANALFGAEIQPIFCRSFKIAVAMGTQALTICSLTLAHYYALEIVIQAHTERPGPTTNALAAAAMRTFQICRGVQLMRDAGLFEVPDCLDFGIIWPLQQAAVMADSAGVRKWVLDLFNKWPLELVMVTILFPLFIIHIYRFRTRRSRKSARLLRGNARTKVILFNQ
jgi:hypothetical protein